MRKHSKPSTIAEHAALFMAERRMRIIWYGCPAELHEIAKRAGIERGRKDNPRSRHPLNVINRVLAGLERSERFEKKYIQHLGRPARPSCYEKSAVHNNHKAGTMARGVAARMKKTKRSSAVRSHLRWQNMRSNTACASGRLVG